MKIYFDQKNLSFRQDRGNLKSLKFNASNDITLARGSKPFTIPTKLTIKSMMTNASFLTSGIFDFSQVKQIEIGSSKSFDLIKFILASTSELEKLEFVCDISL